MTAELKQAETQSLPDRVGIWMSALCVVHCIATPVLISFSAVLAHLLPAEESVHRTLATLVAAAGAIALIRGFRVHGRRRILALMALGLGFIFFGAWFGDHLPAHVWEVLITLTGSTLMIAAHRMNHTFCRDCKTCVH
jgi:hypothetical protein